MISKLNDEELKTIAANTNGIYLNLQGFIIFRHGFGEFPFFVEIIPGRTGLHSAQPGGGG